MLKLFMLNAAFLSVVIVSVVILNVVIMSVVRLSVIALNVVSPLGGCLRLFQPLGRKKKVSDNKISSKIEAGSPPKIFEEKCIFCEKTWREN